MLAGWWMALSALAAPRFTGAPEDVRLADLAWEAAARCAGREGSAAETVEIVRKTVIGDYLGVARTDTEGRLYRIELNTDESRRREVLTHEITHAWISEGPVALVEGAAELLADCMSASQHGLAPLQFDDGRDLAALPDLLAWDKPVEGQTSELHAVRTDGYVGAARLMRTVAQIVPPSHLFVSSRLAWSSLYEALEAAGPSGIALREALESGPDAQRRALADADRDGLTAIAESILGTSDQRYDSDGDGWWDGAPPAPAGARVLPLDGTPICAGQSLDDSHPLAIVTGGNLRGGALPEIDVRRIPGEGQRATLVSFVSSPPADSTGGSWVLAESAVDSPACRSDRTVTVWAESPRYEPHLEALADALGAALGRADRAFGPGPARIALSIGGDQTAVDGEIVRLSAREVDRMLSNEPDPVASIAALAVSLRRLWFAGDRDWSGAVALSRALLRAR